MCPVAFPDAKGFFDLRFFKIHPKCLLGTHNAEIRTIQKIGEDGDPHLIAKFYFNENFEIKFSELKAKKLKHDNVVDIKGYFWKMNMHYDPAKNVIPGKPQRALIMEYCSEGDLYNFINRFKKLNSMLPKDLFLSFSQQMASGINYLHKKDIIHRDLKTKNVFIAESNGQKIAKIGDYEDSFMEIDEQKRAVGGTDYWKAPEVLKGEFTIYSDFFAFALIMWSMIKQIEPKQVRGDEEFFNMEVPPISDSVTAFFSEILKPHLWGKQEKRRSIEEFLSNFNECQELIERISDDDWKQLPSPS